MSQADVMKPPDAPNPPDLSRYPELWAQSATAEQPVEASASAAPSSGVTVAEAEPAPARVARGRGEPKRTASRTPRAAAAASRPVLATTIPQASVTSPTAAAAPPANHAQEATPRTPAPLAGNDQVPEDHASEPEDNGYAGGSRLGGLRNLLVSLGRRSLAEHGELAREADSDLEPRFERATMRPAYSDTPSPAADAADTRAPARLTAHPEFLRPKPIVEVEKEKEPVRPTTPRRDYPDSDEIQTLPSWRGQYRKKRYPPI